MIPLEAYCHKCDHPYTITDNYKTCPECDKKKLEHKMFWATMAILVAMAFIFDSNTIAIIAASIGLIATGWCLHREWVKRNKG